jgi:S-DNA-T family DNA segregation ATPase FtsK/SpoIIIE
MKPIRLVLSPTRNRPVNVFLGLMLLLVSTLLLLSLATWRASDPSLNTATASALPHNWTGLFGAYLGDLLLQSLGMTAFLLPIWLGGLGWTWMRSRPGGSGLLRSVGAVLALVFVPVVVALLPWHWQWQNALPIEGVMGRLMGSLLVHYLNLPGTWIASIVLAAAGLYFATAISFRAFVGSIQDRWRRFSTWRNRRAGSRLQRAHQRARDRAQDRAAPLALHDDEQDATEEAASPEQFSSASYSDPLSQDFEERRARFMGFFSRRNRPLAPDPLDEIPAFQRAGRAESEIPISEPARRTSIWERDEIVPATSAVPPDIHPMQYESPRQQPAAAPPPTAQAWSAAPRPAQPPIAPPIAARPTQPEPIAAPRSPAPPASARQRPDPPARPEDIAIHERADAEVRSATVAPKHVSGFRLPPSTLLNAGEGPQTVREDALRDEAKVLVEKCAEFDVRGQVVQINPGPMVTTYEFKPEAGVKYSRVTSLAEDLCLAMRAESILIERMPGKATVGIQVPNFERETIHLRDVLESETFARAKSRLTLAMGKDINGRIVTADLASMPHVLIAGSTGSGKSVAINAMIMSLLFRTTPAQVRLILVDPKRVELGMYEGVPHLFTPIITEPKLAANALRNAVREMERRLKLLASRSVRNIEQYNKLFDGSMPSLFDEGEEESPLPFIVIIIDELADLMMLDRANVEESITRLAQMARAVGIHLILATQRPSVDVITGLIKANVPSRISFRLATKVDSRTILDTNGAEALLGRGDMLFLPPGTARLQRLHAPFVSEKETAAVVRFWKDQGEAEYVEGFLESPKDDRANVEGSNSDEEENDPLFDEAVRMVFEAGKASTSLLQRRLRIGYGRAAHLIDLMERDGLVGAPDGSRPRELLKSSAWLNEVSVGNE